MDGMLNVPSKQSRIKLLFYSVEKAMIKIFYLPADDNNRRYLMIMKVKQTEMPLCLKSNCRATRLRHFQHFVP